MAERGNYRSISCSLLSGKDFRKLPERARWIFVVLKMNFNFVGIETWYPDELLARLVSESGATPDQVNLALDFLEHEGWLEREDNVIWLKGHITHDPHIKVGDKKHRTSAQRHIAGLPRLNIVRRFVATHPDWFPRQEGEDKGLAWAYEGPKKGHVSKDKEKDKEKDISAGAGKSDGVTPLPRPKPWPAEGSESWSEKVAPIEPGRFGKAMKPMVDKYGWPDSRNAMIAYIECNEGLTRKVEWLVGDAVRWIALGKMPISDENGLTERGKLTDKAARRVA